jgi:PDZ domain-containing protein
VDQSVPVGTGHDVGPPGPDPALVGAPGHRRSRRWRLSTAVAIAVVVALVGTFWRMPYYTLSPGSLRATQSLIAVEGAATYPDDAGEVGYLTVTFGQSTPFGLLRGWLDDDIEVLTEFEALGGRDRDENRQVNQQLMNNAKDTAVAVALDALGYDVAVVGSGAVVVGVEPGTPAAGVLELGDTVVSVNGAAVGTSVEFTTQMAGSAPGDTVVLGVQRHDAGTPALAPADGGTPVAVEVPVTLAARPDDPAAGYLGVRTTTRDIAYNLPFAVTIDSGNVIGPSAGLAFTLGVIDMLTPGNLTGGAVVAVTGTIAPSGAVGPVGGVPQKAAAAIDAGATVYLVPPDEFDQAVARAGSAMEVVAVASLDEALAALARITGDDSVVQLVAAAAGRT